MIYTFEPGLNTLIVAQVGALRIIGIENDLLYDRDEYNGIVKINNAGALITQRGAMPGNIAGTVMMTKSVSIVGMDFCAGPLKMIEVKPDLMYKVTEDYMSKEEVEVYEEHYGKFITGEASNLITQGKAAGATP